MNRELIEKSMTYKNSSENFSVSQSVYEVESEKINRDKMIRVSSNSSYLNKINQSASNLA